MVVPETKCGLCVFVKLSLSLIFYHTHVQPLSFNTLWGVRQRTFYSLLIKQKFTRRNVSQLHFLLKYRRHRVLYSRAQCVWMKSITMHFHWARHCYSFLFLCFTLPSLRISCVTFILKEVPLWLCTGQCCCWLLWALVHWTGYICTLSLIAE